MKTETFGRAYGLLIALTLLGLALTFSPVLAHASLYRSEPEANAVLSGPPAEIRLYFTEPLEPQFSAIFLRDSSGNLVQTPSSQVDPSDPTQLFLAPGDLPDGVYTVAWRVLSTADGHPSLGTFPIVIGANSGLGGVATGTGDTIPLDGALARWANLFSLALGVGGVAFLLFVWKPAVPDPLRGVERRIRRLLWIGWALIGLTGFLMLFLQYALATGNPLLSDLDGRSLNNLVTGTRFGHLWLARMAFWSGLGGALWFAGGDRWFYWAALLLGLPILGINSAFSHANAAFDLTTSVAVDFVHLVAMVLWVGSLIHFLNVIGPLRRLRSPSAPALGLLVAHFTSFARVSVAALVITGLYSSWLQVGSLDGLLTTAYGQSLLIKLILILPLLGIAAVNTIYTRRGLAAGQEVWATRLRGLVGAEIALAAGILLAVGLMTSATPARNTLAQRASAPPAPKPITESLTADDLTGELIISPGWVGQNTFTLRLTGVDGQPINDASLIRLRFEDQAGGIGESELRPQRSGDGLYTITGANLSASGEWRIRATVQRPNQFDALMDFRPAVPDAPLPPPPLVMPSADRPLPDRVPALLATGIMALAIGGYFLGESRGAILRASTLLALALLVVGGLLLGSALTSVPEVSAQNKDNAIEIVSGVDASPAGPVARR